MNQIPNIEEEYRYYQAPNVPIERVFAQTNDGTRYELLEVNYHLKEEEELEETVEFDKVFDCFDEGCGECTVCKYINFREWAEGCGPAGSSIERNQLVEDYLKRKHHQLQKARQDWLREEKERVIDLLIEEGYLRGRELIPHDESKKSHGTCCYCGTCGHDNDYCVCEHNQLLQTIKDRYHSELDQDNK